MLLLCKLTNTVINRHLSKVSQTTAAQKAQNVRYFYAVVVVIYLTAPPGLLPSRSQKGRCLAHEFPAPNCSSNGIIESVTIDRCMLCALVSPCVLWHRIGSMHPRFTNRSMVHLNCNN